jgi:hypothetical protein
MMEINQEDFNQVEMASKAKRVGQLIKHCDIDFDVCVTRVSLY